VETLKQEVAELTIYKLMVEEVGDMVSMHRAEDKVSPGGKWLASKREVDFAFQNMKLIPFYFTFFT